MNKPSGKIEASYYKPLDGGRVQCLICPHECKIVPGRVGICRTRTAEDGKIFLLNYGRLTSLALDPIEKKPLYHFFPGSRILSIGGLGCNLTCGFCQNWQISQGDAGTRTLMPEQVVDEAASCSRENIGLAFTYNEPLIWFEFIRDTAPLLREKGLKVVLVTNGFINPEPFAELAPLIDAMNIDLKSSDNKFYRKSCSGSVEPVKATIAEAVRRGIWVEVTQLLIPGMNDDEEQIRNTVSWLAGVSSDVPLHFSRYFPNYQMNTPPTPPASLERAFTIATEQLNYVYLGNVGDPKYGETRCPGCGNVVIRRDGYHTHAAGRGKNLTCGKCGVKVAGVE